MGWLIPLGLYTGFCAGVLAHNQNHCPTFQGAGRTRGMPAGSRSFTATRSSPGSRPTTDRVHAFDLRVIDIIRHFLLATDARIRRKNVDAAAFVTFQSVRATMLACLLERPPGLQEDALVAELVDLVLRYLVGEERVSRPAVRPRRPGR